MARFHFKFYPLLGLTEILFTSIQMPLFLAVSLAPSGSKVDGGLISNLGNLV